MIVNAASQSDPRVYVRAGADLVLFSAHKFFAGLTAGIIGGKMELVQACMYQGQGIGRPMKVGKEGVIGAIAALEQWMALDPVHERNVLEARLQRFQDRLIGLTGVAVSQKGNRSNFGSRQLMLESRLMDWLQRCALSILQLSCGTTWPRQTSS